MYKQATIKPSAIPRFYALFIILLFTSLFLFGYNYFDSWLMEKKYAISSVADKMRLQIKDYRYHAENIFEQSNMPSFSSQKAAPSLEVSPNIYWLESNSKNIDAIIFGRYNDSSIQLAQKLSNYLEILWGSRSEYKSMYYLNGKDNNLLLVTTHPILKPEIKFKESYLTLTSDFKRSEMLAQSIALDERESISSINVLRGENIYFYTYKAAFNSPGQLTTVIAFDLPINNLLPPDMSPANFRLYLNNEYNTDKTNKVDVSLNGFWLEFSQPLNVMPYKLIYQVPLKALVVDLLLRNIWLLLSILLFLLLSFSGLFYIRQRYITPNASMDQELKIKDSLENDIVSNIPIGLLVYDFSSNQLIISNKIAEKLMPYLDLNKVKVMAEQHHGVIQTSIEDAVYEVKMYSSNLLPETYLFLLQDRDQEVMINKRLLLAQREYEKSAYARRSMLLNVNNEIKKPILELNDIVIQLKERSQDEDIQYSLDRLLAKSEYITEWVENISLLNELESDDWKPTNEIFSLSSQLENILKISFPTLNAKNLKSYYHFNIPHESIFYGDRKALSKIVSLLLNYAITTTSYGKISLNVSSSGKNNSYIQIELIDSGSGLSKKDLNSLNYPFLHQLAEDKYYTNSGLAFYLCNKLCKKMGGNLEISSKLGLGTHYVVSLPLSQQDEDVEIPQLLEGIIALIDISNPEIKKIIHNHLDNYGATYFEKSTENVTEEYDIILTDKQNKTKKPTILLVGNLVGFKQMQTGLVQCNYNFVGDVINAISLLIEENLNLVESDEISSDLEPESDFAQNIDSNLCNILKSYYTQLVDSSYRKLFIETVPMDVTKLYTDMERYDLISLSQTVHRLKGAFAMLDFKLLKTSCEALEQHIADNNEIEIKSSISRIDSFVTKLLQPR
ncbi:phosphotransferase RcsD [Xenorhabdus innexi]|uniref:Phosphotransferase RcsD n=1 Tax=Xenorhabdus innexi TaxID=290109 RepID=A0A1N6MWE4_9GAMM|nr:phosphotransferase RcsD [Xenorhabdus innexi]PHM37468.1 encodes hybrid sensory histidine kinase in two-component regulatory system with EvgA [Xenorhabdus innexi]SIP73059.1 putative sensory histidine kinase (Phosphotransfer intermediate) associated with the RcsBC two-component regulatory system [Xenorhabdus innexi]